jgi:hypothetical protein
MKMMALKPLTTLDRLQTMVKVKVQEIRETIIQIEVKIDKREIENHPEITLLERI